MRRLTASSAIGFALFLFVAAPTDVMADQALSSEELCSLLSGNTLFGTNTRGKDFIQVFHTDGKLESGGEKGWGSWEPKEIGTWSVDDGQLCNSYTKPKQRDGGCDKFFEADDGQYYYLTGSGKKGLVRKIVPGGNPG